MAYESLGKMVSLPTAAALVQYTFADLDGSGKAVVPGTGVDCVGIVQNNPKSGSASGDTFPEAEIMIGPGFSKVVAGAAISVGWRVSCDNQGRAVPAATGSVVLGRLIGAAATAAGDVVTVLFQKEVSLVNVGPV